MLARAAPAVVRVCQVSHVLGDPCPSSSNPRCAVNADSTLDRAAVCMDAARSRPRRQSACTETGADAASAVVSQDSPVSTIASAWLADDGLPTSAEPGGGKAIRGHLLRCCWHQVRETNQGNGAAQ